VRYIPVHLSRAGLNPFKDQFYRRELERIFTSERPDVVLAYTIKPVIHGMRAAEQTGVPGRYALITGLGAAFHTSGLKGWVLRMAGLWFYRRSLRHCTRIMVQNGDIAEFFLREGIVKDRSRLMVVAGSGVDTLHFTPTRPPKDSLMFILLARMLRDKGVEEYVSAARVVKRQLPQARFLLVGDTDPNPAAIFQEQLDVWNREGVVEYRPAVSDVRPLLAECSVYVLPSYHEGMPRSVLEAMATGRPVITTDAIGCRETVINVGPPDSEGIRLGDNGLLVPIRGVAPLAAAMLRLAGDAGLREKMGRRGREIAEQRFDVRLINDVMLRAMDLIPARNSSLATPRS
ncbi:MAG: glycosyltransferase family 4 protein, partial [bacterium]|nr:glycosyltransferase family 4 protein [bacterium]